MLKLSSPKYDLFKNPLKFVTPNRLVARSEMLTLKRSRGLQYSRRYNTTLILVLFVFLTVFTAPQNIFCPVPKQVKIETNGH